jgi:hypothetical protein
MIDTWSEEYRHQCLVRYVIRWRIKNRNEALAFISRWMEKRPNDLLERDVYREWKLGNRGVHDDWRSKNEQRDV